MLTRTREQSETVDWGSGTSDRLLVADDNMGFAVAHTVVKAGTSSKLQSTNHLEACYCIAGSGSVIEKDGTVHEITPGTIYVLDEHDAHDLRGGENEDLVLVSIFNPPITGDEKHTLTEDGYSGY